MKKTNLYGLIGKTLKHSFSSSYFAAKFDELNIRNTDYVNFEFEDPSQIVELKERPEIKGLNVTIPYKETVLPFLDEVDSAALEIGAVNTIKIQNGEWIGYNTDCLGFADTLKNAMVTHPHIKKALILGSGGASKAIQYVLNKQNISYLIISRKGKDNYDNLTDNVIAESHLIINTTPLGMYPEPNNCPDIHYQCLTPKHYGIDLIYNPEKTLFLTNCEAQGAGIMNGHNMLISQAEHSWEIWKRT